MKKITSRNTIFESKHFSIIRKRKQLQFSITILIR